MTDNQYVFSFLQQRICLFPEELSGPGEQIVQVFAAVGLGDILFRVKEKLVELGVSALCDDPTALPRPPNSVDDLLSKKILPTP